MLTKVKKWGSSLALCIPGSIAAAAQIENNSLVEVSLLDGQIVVKKVTLKWTLDELLAGITNENIHSAVW